MQKPIVLLGQTGSSFVPELETALRRKGLPCRALSLDAAFEGRALTVHAGAVLWEGADLLQAGAVFVEQPLFPWPQPQIPPEGAPLGREAFGKWAQNQRESRSLSVAGLCLAAEERPVLNPPAMAHLAASPAMALLLLARAGMAVHPWRLGPACDFMPGDKRLPEDVKVDPAGPDYWHKAEDPGPDDPTLFLTLSEERVYVCLVIGDRIAGCIKYANVQAWAADQARLEKGDAIEGADAPGRAFQETSVRAASSLGLDFAAIALIENNSGPKNDSKAPPILFCRAAPDLGAWNRRFSRRVIPILVDHLARRAMQNKGTSS
ncbi:MAG: hypothetical protein ABIK28_06840 [Planctomycetota bacterium]